MKKRLALAAALAFQIIPITSFADHLEPDESEIKPSGDLAHTNLVKADLRYVDLTEANLTDAKLSKAELLSANLKNAKGYNINFYGANLQERSKKYFL